MTLPDGTELFFVSNGHGEDEIAASILDALAPTDAQRTRIAAWAQVGHGDRYKARGIKTLGPEHHLPSEGFGTVSIGNFVKDLKAGFIRTYFDQARYARTLRGSPALMVAIGDIIPLLAGRLSGMQTLFYSAPKSAHYGGYDGHTVLERHLMKRCTKVMARDALTAKRLTRSGVRAECLGNPVMDRLDGTRDTKLRPTGKTVVVLLAGSRADAVQNTRTLLAGLANAASDCHGLIAAHPGLEETALLANLPTGWSVSGHDLTHRSGATATLMKARFADALASADLALGMAGSANEQAVGLGLPLIAVPGAGNQGPAFQRMKARYFGASALSVEADPTAMGAALDRLIADPARRLDMAEAGRELMGPRGGSQAIAQEIAAHLAWELRG